MSLPSKGFFQHPLWLVGFRPFFSLAFLAAVLLPLAWALAFWGKLALPTAPLLPFQWHAYEMLYGFGWAVLAGFLLTASKNWVHVRGMHGAPLGLAVLLWLVERAALLSPAVGAHPLLRVVLLNAFGLYVIAYLVWTLVRFRRQDTFPDNLFFIVALPLFVLARNLMLHPAWWAHGVGMTLGLYRVAFAVMFERTMTQFMKNAMMVDLPRRRPLDLAIKVLVLVSALETFLPAPWAAAVLGAAGVLLLLRLLTWRPLLGLSSFPIAVMYVGYLALVGHLLLSSAQALGALPLVGTVKVHLFAFLCMGVVIPGMLIRICQGHTGRSLRFTGTDRVGIGAIFVGSFFRLVAPQLWPASYAVWTALAATCWSFCFLLLGVRLVPYLWQPRVDGKEH